MFLLSIIYLFILRSIDMGISVGPSGITMNDELMNLSKGWFVVCSDGSLIVEGEMDWLKIKKDNIKILGLKWYDKFWTISGQTAYIQLKRGSAGFSASGDMDSDITCEERCIGYYEGKLKVIYRVNERTGKMTPTVQAPPNDNNKGS